MGKRSNFERVERDFYPTPESAVLPLLPHLSKWEPFFEPCAGDGALAAHLVSFGYECAGMSDIEPMGAGIAQRDALALGSGDTGGRGPIITNSPWRRDILHPMILHFITLAPTWLLIDADWAYTKQAKPFLKHCYDIVPVGRVQWIEGSKNTGKDNCAWYRFGRYPSRQIIFHG